jgi:hypothetical protein
VLLWYAHGSYVNALIRGPHEYLLCEHGPAGDEWPVPTLPWPDRLRRVTVADLRADRPDVVIIQRTEEIGFCSDVLGFRPAYDVPAVFLEHNIPRDGLPSARHPLADLDRWLVVQVTEVNALLWDAGRTATVVVPHGVPDPGHRYSGELARAAFVANEPVRRTRVAGADLLARVAPDVPVDAYGIDADRLPAAWPDLDLHDGGNLSLTELWDAIACRRLYLHLNRWTSLGLSLLEAMHLGLPVVVLAMTGAATLPPEIGAVSADPGVLRRRVRELLADPDEARRCGEAAREVALQRFRLDRFLSDWDAVLDDAVGTFRRR